MMPKIKPVAIKQEDKVESESETPAVDTKIEPRVTRQ